ncbi:MAG: MFS transporter, partial [Acidimicrobiales bacterium]
TFALAALPVGLAWAVFAVLAKEPPRPAGAAAPARLTGPVRLLAFPDARRLCAFYSVTFGGFVGLASYLPIFFVDRFGLTKVSAAGYAALCTVAGSLLRPLGGALADRLGGTRVLTAVLAAVGAIGVGLAALPGLGPTVAMLFCALGALGMGNGAVLGLVPARFPTQIGAVVGLVGAAGGLGGFALPFVLGSLANALGSFTPGFACIAAAAAGAAMGAVRVEARWRHPAGPELAVA